MQFFLRDTAGRTFEALLLATSPSRMRLVVRNFDDAVELVSFDGIWKTEEGRVIEIGAIIADGTLSREFFDSLIQLPAAG